MQKPIGIGAPKALFGHILQYGFVYALMFALIGLFVTLIIHRNAL